MTRRNFDSRTGAARRAMIVGTLPLALAVACSSATDPQSAAPASSANGTGPSSTSQAPGGVQSPGAAQSPGGAQSRGEGAAQAPGNGAPAPQFANPRSAQPGVAAPTANADRLEFRPGPIQPGVTTVPRPAAPGPSGGTSANYAVPPNFRAIPQPEVAPAINWQELHAPTVVTPVAPIAPPPRTLRLGNFTTPAPDQLPDNILNPVNTTAATAEAAIATGFNSIGINPTRSDRIAAGTLAGVAAGATGGALIAGVPAAVLGAAPGAVAGAVIGLGVGAAVGTVVAGGLTAASVVAGVATGGAAGALTAIQAAAAAPEVAGFAGGGALIGAGVGGAAGAAIVGIPAAVVGGVAGGVAGGAVGGFLGGAF
ncbi:hypothetical protein [Nocardia sp. NBC_01327]|uniref:hypothetical protein n=1 Tax=Nocardia sp. NBC_01327 TaxID=2903593 RepID=UPI002E1238A3|nr:hypothetical protein OG326_00465 [Nocardia sp. NBC_01327]